MSGKRKHTSSGQLNQLGELLQKAGIHIESRKESPTPPTTKRKNPDSNPKESPAKATDEELFSEAMHDVKRASWKNAPHLSSEPVRTPDKDPEAEEKKMMQEAMAEDIPIPEHPEYIEGWIGVTGKRFLPNLRNGLYSIQGQIDLHGMNREEAQIAVEEYIVRMSRFRSCCIKIIHGRGINSPSDRATLKENLQRFLSTRRMSRYVVAYASAPARDGGVGCVYVLLSRHQA